MEPILWGRERESVGFRRWLALATGILVLMVPEARRQKAAQVWDVHSLASKLGAAETKLFPTKHSLPENTMRVFTQKLRFLRGGSEQQAIERQEKKIEDAETELSRMKSEYDKLALKLKNLQEESRQTQEQINIGDTDSLSQFTEAIDARSIFVGNVDYQVKEQMLEDHFNSCGTISRITIPQGVKGPKGFAYVEFTESSAVDSAMKLNNTSINGRTLLVTHKRTNRPGIRPLRRKGRFT